MHRTTVEPDDSISQMGVEIISESNASETDTQVAASESETAQPCAKEGGSKPPDKEPDKEAEDVSKKQAPIQRRPRRSIFIGYSPDAGFLERKLVLETVKQIKLNGLSESIWFDADESISDSCCNLAYTLEAVERCRAALLFLSDSFFASPLSHFVGQTLIERLQDKEGSVRVFSVLTGPVGAENIAESSAPLLKHVVDLHDPKWRDQSVAEKCTAVLGAFMVELERFAATLIPYLPEPFGCNEPGRYKRINMAKWSVGDLQDWLYDLGVREFYRQSFAEEMVDGFLVGCMTDEDLSKHVSIESRVVRKKLTNQVLTLLDKEHKVPQNWHLRAKGAKVRPQTVYLIFDPNEARLGKSARDDLTKKGLKVLHHNKLGQSKEEFLRLNVTGLSTAAYVLLLLTENSLTSPFVFHEVMFASWLNKRIMTLLFKNGWYKLRPSLRAVLGDSMAVDFESRRFADAMSIVDHVLRPSQTMPGLVLEQTYLNKMTESVVPLRDLARTIVPSVFTSLTVDRPRPPDPVVFLSCQADMTPRVVELRRCLEAHELPCWADLLDAQRASAASFSPGVNNGGGVSIGGAESVQSQIQRSMKVAKVVLCCVTPKYLHSETCSKDLALAELLKKPIIPLLMRFSPWPPEHAPMIVKKFLARTQYIDFSNEKLFRANSQILIDRVRKFTQK